MPSMNVREIRLDSVVFHINRDYKERAGEGGFTYRLKMDSDLDAERRLLWLRLGVETPAKEENPHYPFYFDVTLAGMFEFSESIPEETRNEFATFTCPTMIFPYLRETLADLTRRAGFPPLHLPLTDLTEFAQQNGFNPSPSSAKEEGLPET